MSETPGKTPSSDETGAGAGGGFDRVLERLRGVVERLEAGSLSLEESLGAFEEGVRLSRRGAEILDRAEKRVELLLRGPGDSERVVDFPDAGEAGELGDGRAGGSSLAAPTPRAGGPVRPGAGRAK